MADFFAGSEIVELAIQIEKNGFDFYTTLAGRSRDPLAANMFSFLALEEEKHIAAFKTVCENTDGCGTPETASGDYLAYMNALASEHVFTRQGRGAEIARAISDDGEAIDKAIGFEQDSIVFYEGMRSFIPADQVIVVEALIAQEKSHLLKLVTMKKTKRVP